MTRGVLVRYRARMLFTQQQARAAVGLSTETLRHWRGVVPYLAARSGRGARFTFGDLVTLAGLRSMIDEVGLTIGQFARSGETFFEACNRLPWIEATHVYALICPDPVIQPDRGRRAPAPVTVAIVRGNLAEAIQRATIVVPLAPLADALRRSWMGAWMEAKLDADAPQLQLPLPPTAVTPPPRRVGRV